MPPRLKILLSAYACEPNKGSEPGLGWQLAIGLARHLKVVVLTRANNRNSIDEALSDLAPEHRPEFAYLDLPKPLLQMKKLLGAHRWYYILWQKQARAVVSARVKSRDISILHHVSYASYRYPTAVLGHRIPAVWGPVGGVEQTPWNLLPWAYPRALPYELARNLSNCTNRLCAGHLAKTWNQYERVLTSTRETRKFFESRGISSDLIPAIGLPPSKSPHPSTEKKIGNVGIRLLYIGALQYLKGIHFVLEALRSCPDSITLTIVGSGSFENELRHLCVRYNLSARIRFHPHQRQSDLPQFHQSHDVFVFPSLHDSGGMAALEAMDAGMPVICFDCGGPALAVDKTSGIKIPLGAKDSLVAGLSHAIKHYNNNPADIRLHGHAAKERVDQIYSWPRKIERIVGIYSEIISRESSTPLHSR